MIWTLLPLIIIIIILIISSSSSRGFNVAAAVGLAWPTSLGEAVDRMVAWCWKVLRCNCAVRVWGKAHLRATCRERTDRGSVSHPSHWFCWVYVIHKHLLNAAHLPVLWVWACVITVYGLFFCLFCLSLQEEHYTTSVSAKAVVNLNLTGLRTFPWKRGAAPFNESAL